MTGQRPPQHPAQAFYAGGSGNAAVANIFTAPCSGWFRIVLWGAGGGYNSGPGGGGALVIAERALVQAERITLSIGAGDNVAGVATDTTATFNRTGEVLRAGAGLSGSGAAGGVATGNATLDILVNGAAAGASAAGAAGTYSGRGPQGIGAANYQGGAAGGASDYRGGFPGGGVVAGGGPTTQGAPGCVIIEQVRLRS